MARAFDWQSRGRRFDSVRLHEVGVSVGVIVWVWGVWKGEEFEPGLREKGWFFVFASILPAEGFGLMIQIADTDRPSYL